MQLIESRNVFEIVCVGDGGHKFKNSRRHLML